MAPAQSNTFASQAATRRRSFTRSYTSNGLSSISQSGNQFMHHFTGHVGEASGVSAGGLGTARFSETVAMNGLFFD